LTILANYLGGLDVAGGKMKAISPLWYVPNVGATNESGFSGLPGGYRYQDGDFEQVGSVGRWWTASAWQDLGSFWTMGHFLPIVQRHEADKRSGYCVRCVRD
jgi:uncharacterized protein (TIGR02145 family)